MTGDLATPLCRRLGMSVPVIQAPIGSATSAELVAAVSDAGGLGVLSATWLTGDELARRVHVVRTLTDRRFGVNLVLAFPWEAKLRQCLELGIAVIATSWGDAASLRPVLAGSPAIHLHACGSVAEARASAAAGVDAVVAQGWEAGGHVIGTTASLPLIPAVVDAVRPTPVVAAGGIADGRGLAAAMVLGAQAVMVGTRFVAATEADTHEAYRQLVVDALPDMAQHTMAFNGGWQAPHRVLANSTLTAWEAAGRPSAPGRPGEDEVVGVDPTGRQWLRYDDMIPLAGMTGRVEEMALYAGQSAGLVHEVMPAADILAQMVFEARSALAAVSDLANLD